LEHGHECLQEKEEEKKKIEGNTSPWDFTALHLRYKKSHDYTCHLGSRQGHSLFLVMEFTEAAYLLQNTPGGTAHPGLPTL
jgi:hypothetical protein